jgi:hypothetical protein
VGALLAARFGSECVVMVVVMGARPKKLESDLPKRQKLKVVGCLRTLVHRDSSMKQYVNLLRLILPCFSFGNLLLLLYCDLTCSCGVALIFSTE